MACTTWLGTGGCRWCWPAVDYLRPLYRAASSYPQILEQGLTGNPGHLGAHELHRRAWSLVGDRFRTDQLAVAVRCSALERHGRATSDLRWIVPAAILRYELPDGQRAAVDGGPLEGSSPRPSRSPSLEGDLRTAESGSFCS